MIWMNERNLLRVAELTSGATGKYRCWRHTEVEVETPCTFKGRRLPLGRPGAPPHHRHPPELPPQDIPPPLFVFLSLLFFFFFYFIAVVVVFFIPQKAFHKFRHNLTYGNSLSLSLSLFIFFLFENSTIVSTFFRWKFNWKRSALFWIQSEFKHLYEIIGCDASSF